MKRTLLITGATGKQGRALIHAVLNPPAPAHPNVEQDIEWQIIALTRSKDSTSAKRLETDYSPQLKLIEGDLNNAASIKSIFNSRNQKKDSSDQAREGQREGEGIWGVFAVLQYPGLGIDSPDEENQGRLLADLAVEFGVKCFVYSSASRAGPKYEGEVTLSWRAKREVEGYCRGLGEKGLPWSILRPGFFMENFEGGLGKIAAGVLRVGLKEEGVLGVIGSEDIGNVAAGIFRNHEMYKYKTVTCIAEFSTMSRYDESYRRALGKPMPAIPNAAAWALIKINKGTQDLIKHLTATSEAKKHGEWSDLEEEMKLANEAFRMRTYEGYLKEKRVESEKEGGNWNGLSLGKLLTGRV